MLGGFHSLKRTKLGGVGFCQSGSAAQKLALDSFQNIANIDIASTVTATPDIDAEVEAIGNVLRAAATLRSTALIEAGIGHLSPGQVIENEVPKVRVNFRSSAKHCRQRLAPASVLPLPIMSIARFSSGLWK